LDKKEFENFKLPQDFPTFVHWVANQTDDELNEHFKSMSAFCGIREGMKFDLIARLEEIDDWGPSLVQRLGIEEHVDTGWGGGFFRTDSDNVAHNRHSETKLLQFYTPELMRIVEGVYKEDFVRFGYTMGELR